MAYVSDITRNNYTKSDFLGLLEKRIRKQLRISQLINLKDSYVILNRDDIASEVLMYFLETIFSKRMIVRFVNDLSELKKGDKLLYSQYLEEYAGKKLEVFFAGTDISVLSEIHAPLRVLSAKEINQVAEILSFEGNKVISKNEFIEKLQEKYPQTKTSFLKSFDSLSHRFL